MLYRNVLIYASSIECVHGQRCVLVRAGAAENAGVENTGAITCGKSSKQKL